MIGRPNRTAALLIVLATTWIATPGRAASQGEAKTAARPRAEMQQVFEAVAQLLPIALSEKDWSDPARRPEIQRWIDALASAETSQPPIA